MGPFCNHSLCSPVNEDKGGVTETPTADIWQKVSPYYANEKATKSTKIHVRTFEISSFEYFYCFQYYNNSTDGTYQSIHGMMVMDIS